MPRVVMPGFGETVTEATLTVWRKRVGDHVEAGEALFEMANDKVETEIPAASAGVLVEILVAEGETVPVGTEVAVIDEAEQTGEG